jgi:broad specificity phosphatase PhoE
MNSSDGQNNCRIDAAIQVIILLRHGHTPKGIHNAGLTLAGVGDIYSAVERLKHYPISGIFTDPSERTMETARIWSQLTNVPITVRENLTNWDLGPSHKGKHSDSTDRLVSQLVANPDATALDGGESANHYWGRIMDDLAPMIDSPLLFGVAGHSRGIKSAVVIAQTGEAPTPESWASMPLPNNGAAFIVTSIGAAPV